MRPVAVLAVALLVFLAPLGAGLAHASALRAGPATGTRPSAAVNSTGPIQITGLTPAPGSATPDQTPTISAQFVPTVGAVIPSSVVLIVNGLNLIAAQVEGVNVSATAVSYHPPSILRLANGLHNVTVSVNDTASATVSTVSWNFTVNTNLTVAANPLVGVNPGTIVLYLGIAAALVGAGVGGYILFLRQTTRFTFRRYFATHQVERTYLTIYIPLLVAFVYTILALDWVYNTSGLPFLAPDYVLVGTSVIALTAFGIDSRNEMLRIRAYERAFAQFLFEMADAMRGGIDPAKAVVELSKTHTNILRKPLKVAADGVRLGRPFDVVLRDMVSPLKSRLISRYAALIADATSVGGETATVVYRAAKDMDDFVKIEVEREKQLLLPVAVIYIAFGVLMAVLFALLYIAPSLGSLNVSFLGAGSPLSTGSGHAAAATSVPKLSYDTLEERFFELMFINALGTGAIIGAFTEGRARYGILHSVALAIGTAVIFAILFP